MKRRIRISAKNYGSELSISLLYKSDDGTSHERTTDQALDLADVIIKALHGHYRASAIKVL